MPARDDAGRPVCCAAEEPSFRHDAHGPDVAVPGDHDDRAVQVSPGDTLFVYTDGLTDRRTASGEFYSIDRVASLIERHHDAELNTIYDAIYSDVRRFSATDEFKDDIAFIVTRFH